MVGRYLFWAWRYVGESTRWTKAGCHQYWSWGSLEKGPGWTKAWGCLLAAHKAQHLKYLWTICKLDEARFQDVTKVGQVMFPRLVHIQICCQCWAYGHLQKYQIILRWGAVCLGTTDPGSSTCRFCLLGLNDPPEAPTGWNSALPDICSHLVLKKHSCPFALTQTGWSRHRHHLGIIYSLLASPSLTLLRLNQWSQTPIHCVLHSEGAMEIGWVGSLECPALGLRWSQTQLIPPTVRTEATHNEALTKNMLFIHSL